MNTGVKVLLAVLIVALALDVTLIVAKTRQSNPEVENEVSAADTAENTSSIGSSMIFNFSGVVNRSGDDSEASALDGLSEEEIGAMALAEESNSGSD